MLRETQINGIQVRLVTAGLGYARLQIIRDQDITNTLKIFEGMEGAGSINRDRDHGSGSETQEFPIIKKILFFVHYIWYSE